MDAMKKRHIFFWIVGIILFIICIFYLLRLSQRDDDFFLAETSETISETTETTDNSSNDQNVSIESTLKAFGENWLNFSDISERNEQVEEYMTEDAINNSQLDSDTTEDESTGNIKTIAQDIDHPQKYILVGEETTQGETKEIILEIDITGDPSPKISHFEFSYKE